MINILKKVVRAIKFEIIKLELWIWIKIITMFQGTKQKKTETNLNNNIMVMHFSAV